MFRVLFGVFLISSATYIQAKQLPPFLRDVRCRLYHNFDECFVTSGNKVIPLVAKGIPELGVANMIPLKVAYLPLVHEDQLSLNLTNIKVYGLDKLRIINSRSKVPKGEFKIDIKGENITIVADYSVEGKILVLPIQGQGPFSLQLKNGIYNVTDLCIIVKKNGDDYLKKLRTHMEFHFEDVIFNFQNLFNGNQQLGDQVNKFLNENWQYLIGDYGPGIAELLINLSTSLYTKLTDELPMKNVFILD